MAGDWIKVDCTTPDKPEVVAIAAALGIDQDAVVGKCLRLWIWANQQSVDGNALNVTDSFIDRLTYCVGFAEALRKVNWLTVADNKLSIPNFDRHNGQPAKTRALTKERVGKSRTAQKCNAENVTNSLPEKRREEKRIDIDQASEILIPKKMQTEKVQEYFRTWVAHLTLQYPDKVPAENSPQLEMFWQEAARLGPDRFCEAVQYSAANNWATLHERNETAKKTRSSNEKQSGTHGANEDWISVLQAIERFPSRSKEDIDGRKTLLGRERFEAMKRIGSGRISESNDFERNQTLKPMFLKHLEELRHATATGT